MDVIGIGKQHPAMTNVRIALASLANSELELILRVSLHRPPLKQRMFVESKSKTLVSSVAMLTH